VTAPGFRGLKSPTLAVGIHTAVLALLWMSLCS
jgi:hypothetical protein